MDSLTKQQISEKLVALNIAHKLSDKKEDLYALLPEAVRVAHEQDVAAKIEADAAEAKAKEELDAKEKADAEVAAAEAAKVPSLKVANVFDKEGRFVRAYSEAIHGSGFEALAGEYILPRDGFTVQLGETSAEVKEPAPAKVPTADVLTKDGQVVRSYSLDIHGEKFESLAKEFAAPRGLQTRLK